MDLRAMDLRAMDLKTGELRSERLRASGCGTEREFSIGYEGAQAFPCEGRTWIQPHLLRFMQSQRARFRLPASNLPEIG
jgi:hypothetical protein